MQPTFYATSQQIIVFHSDAICSEKQEVLMLVFEFPEKNHSTWAWILQPRPQT